MEAYPKFAVNSHEENQAKYFRSNLEAALKDLKVEGHLAKPAEPKNVKGPLYIDLTPALGTPVMDQGSCGNGYAFSAVDTVNMNNKLYNRYYPLLSSQELTDCSAGIVLVGNFNRGCYNGTHYISMEYMRLYGISSYNDYPQSPMSFYFGRYQNCMYKAVTKYRINNWFTFGDYSCFSRIAYLQRGYAISVAVSGGNYLFYYYKSGVIPQCYGTLVIDHFVVMVGAYLDYNDLWSSYVILKNSFGIGWGESGRIRVSLGGNVCLACLYGIFSV